METYSTQEKFRIASEKERFGFVQFLSHTKLFSSTNWNILLTAVDGYDPYDALIQKVSGGGKHRGIVSKRYIIEIKNRTGLSIYQTNTNEQEGWILEKAKYNKMKKVYDMDPEKNNMLYICFTLKGTLVWNLNDINEKDVVKKEMNRATMASTEDKSNKTIILLKEEDAKHYDYTFTEKDFKQEQLDIIARKRTLIVGKKDAKQIGFNFE